MSEIHGGVSHRRLLINDFILAAAIIAVCTALYFFAVRGGNGDGDIVEIVCDGVAVQTFSLDFDGEYSVGDSGFSVRVSNGIVTVSETDCRDKTCKTMSVKRDSGEIVCLPNRIVVRHKRTPEKIADISAG